MASRSSWRLPFIHPIFLRDSFLQKKSFKTSARWLTVPFLADGGRSFYVYNGQKYVQVIYKKEMVGFKIGSFCLSKVIGYQPKSSKKKQKKR